MIKSINTPLTEDITAGLRAGDSVLLTGTIYTARDAAHGRLINLLNEGKELPINVKDEIILGLLQKRKGKLSDQLGQQLVIEWIVMLLDF